MAKSNKTSHPKSNSKSSIRDASSGQFVVVKPAVESKLKAGKIRDAVRKVNQAQGVKR